MKKRSKTLKTKISLREEIIGLGDRSGRKSYYPQLQEKITLLAEAKERVANILESISDAFVALDNDWRYIYVNKKAGELFGRQPEDLIGKHIWTEFPEGIGQPFYKAYYEAVEEQKSVQIEEYYPPYKRWFENRIYPSKDGLSIFFQDITARKNMEMALSESEERWKFALEGAGDGVWDWNAQTNEVFFSRRWKEMLGYEENEIRNTLDEWDKRVHPDDKKMVYEEIEKHFRGETDVYVSEHRALCKDGTYKWILDRGKVITKTDEGKPLRVIGTHTDITGRKQAEEAMLKSQQQLRKVIDGLSPHTFVGLMTLEGIVIEANRPALEAAGLTAEDVLGKPVEDTYWWNYSVAVRQRLREAVRLAALGTPVRYDEQIKAAGGQFIWLDFSIQPVRDENGKVAFLVPSGNVITERKRAEEKLREREEQLRLFVKYSPAAIAMFDREMRYLVVSQRWLSDYGLGDQNIVGRSHYEIFPEIPERWKEIHRRCLAGAVEKAEEDPFVRTDGTIDWVRWEVHPWQTVAGEIGGIIIFSEVITEGKRNSLLLASEKEILEMISVGLPLPEILEKIVLNIEALTRETIASVLLLDPEGLHVHYGAAPHLPEAYNRALEGQEIGPRAGSCGTAAYRKETVIVTDIETDPLWTDYRELVRPFGLRACWSSPIISPAGIVLGTFAMYYREPRSPDGEDLKLIARATHLAGIAIERHRTEGKLLESEAYNRMLFDQSVIGLALTRMDGKLIDANPAYAKIIGRTIDETLKLTYWDITPQKYLLQEQQQIERLNTTGVYGPYEKEYIHKDGHLVPVRLQGQIIERKGEKSIWSSVEDITERKRAEDELLKYREHLEELVKERTFELEQANIKLQELDRLKSMFIASMSHELRTPLNSVIGFSSILMKEWAGALNDEQKNMSSIILKAGKHLLTLINDVIDVSKVEAGRIDIHHDAFDLHDVITEAAESLAKEIQDKGLHLYVEPIHQQMHTDRSRLLQCILNLFSNAVKFTEKGSVSVTAQKTGEFVEISVTDTGIGIQEEDIPKLFHAFVRLESPLKTLVLGTGLGLYLTKKLLTEVLDGDITVKSKHNEGSTFSLKIPIKNVKSNYRGKG